MKDEEKYLEDEMEKFGERWPYPASFDGYDKDWVDELAEECAKHFYELGKKAMKEQMMEGAVEGLICATITGTNAISFLSPLPKELTAGSEVRIIILPKEDE